MFTAIKHKLIRTKLFKVFLWFKYTRKIGLNKKYSDPSSPKNKQAFIKKTARDNNINILIETGTYLGDMVFANLNNFKKIYSIELDEKLFKRAKRRFEKNNHVTIFHGDSVHVLKKLTKDVETKSLFWLDAHYSGGITAKGSGNTPIEKELRVIFNNWRHGSIVLIDDARLFTGKQGYPKIDTIKEQALSKALKTRINLDIIVIK